MSLVSEPVVPAGTPGAEGTGVGWQENTGVALPVGLTMTGLLWGTGSSAQPGEDTEDQGATVTPPLSQPCGDTYASSVAAYGAQTQHASGGHGSLAAELGTWGCTHIQVCRPSQGTCRGKVQRSWKWWPQCGMGATLHPITGHTASASKSLFWNVVVSSEVPIPCVIWPASVSSFLLTPYLFTKLYG